MYKCKVQSYSDCVFCNLFHNIDVSLGLEDDNSQDVIGAVVFDDHRGYANSKERSAFLLFVAKNCKITT